jgi:hypothetical protein
MADPMTEVLKHQYIYVPHVKDALNLGKQLALAVAQARGTRLRVLAPLKNSVTFHPELAKLEIVTERSGEYVNSTWPHHDGLSWPHLWAGVALAC